eukprot:TRINITY_DN11385_c0_g1_i1.p1 TRINITY_DN11385_c0_g1~~TRINITY_DN11385_c0_g1_i1.p1  ORF type:complete len:537 (+),score=88.21 TRINITY_DN11385_c0_g1_i1:48-1613(+)
MEIAGEHGHLAVAPSSEELPDPPIVPQCDDPVAEAGNELEVHRSLRQEVHAIVKLSSPVLLGLLGQMVQGSIVMIFVGRLGEAELAAAGIGYMFVNITGFSTGYGLASGLDTLCSQEFGRDPNSPLVFIYFQRAVALLFVVALPILVLWYNCEAILTKVFEKDMARLAGLWVRGNIVGLLPSLYFEAAKKYLQAMSVTRPIMVVSLITTALIPVFLYLLIHVLHLGFEGARYAMPMAAYTQSIGITACIFWGGLYKGSLSLEAFRGWIEFLKLGIPGMLMLISEWWAFEVMTIMAGRIGMSAAAVQVVAFNFIDILFMAPLAVACACTTLTGNAIGARDLDAAKRAAKATHLCAGMLAVIDSLLCVLLRDHLPKLYTNDPAVVQRISEMLPTFALFHALDLVQTANAAVMRGIGLQTWGSVCYWVSYFGIALPLGGVLAFWHGMGLRGLWTGMLAGVSLLTILSTLVVRCRPWLDTAAPTETAMQPILELNDASDEDDDGAPDQRVSDAHLPPCVIDVSKF